MASSTHSVSGRVYLAPFPATLPPTNNLKLSVRPTPPLGLNHRKHPYHRSVVSRTVPMPPLPTIVWIDDEGVDDGVSPVDSSAQLFPAAATLCCWPSAADFAATPRHVT